MNWIKRIFSKKVENQCAINLVSKRYKVDFKSTFNGLVFHDVTTYVMAYSEEAAIEMVENDPMQSSINVKANVC